MNADPHYWLHWSVGAWVVFLAYWYISARKLKSVKRRESYGERAIYMAFMVGVYVLMFSDGLSNLPWLGNRFVPFSARVGELGAAIAWAGITLAIWARYHLGENWSATITLKEGHELIRTGPYRRIRHPIYTGMLIGFAGTALALGEYRGLLALAIACTSFFFKARKEERFLVQEFGNQFQDHIRHTGMFLPKVI
jgi:protein-S-isoprenylcysteine O-methyltransferase Ste14